MLVNVRGCSERRQAVLFVIAGEASQRLGRHILYISVHVHSSTPSHRHKHTHFIRDGQNRPMFCLHLVEK